MGLFDSKKTKEHKSHIKNLLSLCFADGNISQSECAMVYEIGEKRLNLSRKEIEDVMKKPKKVKFVAPKNNEERYHQLWDLIILMFADGQVTRGEMDFCTIVATRLGFRPSIVPDLVKAIIDAIEKGKEKEKVKSDLAEWISN